MKTCPRCGETKPFSEYYKQKGCRDGLRPECKVCFREARRLKRLADPEHARAIEVARYARDREKRKREATAWYHANRERAIKARREYYKNNPEVFQRAYAKRMALERGAEHQPYSRKEIYDRDGGKCRLCGKDLPYAPNAFHIDHIVPISLGGADTPANVQLACPPCNRRKWANLEGQLYFAA